MVPTVDKMFSEWLKGELEIRGIGVRDLAKEIRKRPGTLYRIVNGERGVSGQMARQIAHGLKVAENVVLYRAGYLTRDPNDPTQRLDPVALDILALVENKTDAQKRAALAALQALFESLEEGPNGQIPYAARRTAPRKKA